MIRSIAAFFLLFAATGYCEDGPIVAGANIGNVPWEFADASGEFVGFEIDLIKAIADRLGRDVEIVNIPFNGLFSAVQSGRIDVALSSMTITPQRLKSVSFAQPYYDSAQSLTVLSTSDASGLADMEGRVIGVDTGSTGDMWTTSNRQRFGFADVRRFEGLAPAMLDLQSRRIDGYISDIPSLQYFVKDKRHLKVIERIETGEQYSMMFAKDAPLAVAADEILSALKSEGVVSELHRRWFGTAPEANSSTVQVMERPTTP